MRPVERPTFENEASKRIYQFVERHGTVDRRSVREVVSIPEERFGTQLARLKSKGYLEEEEGTLRLALNVGAVEEHATDDFTYVVRPGRHRDFEGLVDAIRDVTAKDTYVVAESVAEQLLYEDAVNRHNRVNTRMFFVATVEDDLVGWTHLDLPRTEKLRDTAQQTVGVVEEYRGHGIGSRLLQRGLDWAEANGYRKVYNSLPATNENALRFLEAHDWNTEAIRKDHYRYDDQVVDEVMMAYRF